MSGRKLFVVAASVATLVSAAVVTAPVADAKPKVKPPAKVAKARLGAVSSNAVSLSWTNPKSSKFKATIVRLVAGTHAPKSVRSGRGIATVSKKRHAVSVGSLAAGTTYTVGLFSSDGKKHYSKPVAVRVQTAPAGVSGLFAQATETTMRLAWSFSPSRSATRVVVRYQRGAAPGTPAVGTVARTSGRATGTTITGLRYGTRYGISIWALDAAGRLSPRTSAVFSTAQATKGSLTGVVTGSGKPLGNVEIEVYLDKGNGEFDDVDSVTTPANGTFSFADLKPGKYEVDYYADEATGGTSEAGYLGQYKDKIVLVGDPTVASVSLDAAAGFSGSVSDTDSGDSIENVHVSAEDEDGPEGAIHTDSDGAYAITALPGSIDELCFYEHDYADDTQPGHQEDCTPVTAVPGKITPVDDVDLELGGAIHGTITNGANAEAEVFAFDAAGDVAGYYSLDGDEDNPNKYKMGGLAPGSYYLCVRSNDEDFESQCVGTAGATAWDGDEDNVDTQGLQQIAVTKGDFAVRDVTVQPTP